MPDGTLIENDLLGVVKEIQERWPQLVVQYVDPSRADVGDAPFRIIEQGRDGKWYEVMSVWQLDKRVIDRLYDSDITRTDVLSRIEKLEEQRRLEALAKREEAKAEADDIALHALRSGQSRYSIRNSDGETVELDLYYGAGRTENLDG